MLFAKNVEGFKKLKEVLTQQENTEWHTYATKEEKTHGYVIFGLDHEVNRMKNTKAPVYVIIIDNKTTLLKLRRNIGAVTRIIVRWERLKNNNEIIQCHKCQAWSHATTNCFAHIKCLKCTENHITSDCKKEKSCPKHKGKSNVLTAESSISPTIKNARCTWQRKNT